MLQEASQPPLKVCSSAFQHNSPEQWIHPSSQSSCTYSGSLKSHTPHHHFGSWQPHWHTASRVPLPSGARAPTPSSSELCQGASNGSGILEATADPEILYLFPWRILSCKSCVGLVRAGCVSPGHTRETISFISAPTPQLFLGSEVPLSLPRTRQPQFSRSCLHLGSPAPALQRAAKPFQACLLISMEPFFPHAFLLFRFLVWF